MKRFRQRLLTFPQLFQRNVVSQIAVAIAEAFTASVWNQDRRAAGDPVDPSDQRLVFVAKLHGVADTDVKLTSRPLALRDQVVPEIGVRKVTLRDRLESSLGAVAIVPNHHFNQVNKLMLGDPLHRFQSIPAPAAGNLYRPIDVLEGLE